MKTVVYKDSIIHIGQNAKENWQILSKASQKSLIFHLKSFPSPYVILTNGDNYDMETIEYCAKLCLENSKMKNLRNVYIEYTVVSNVTKGDIIGEMVYKSCKKVQKIKV